MYFQAWRRDISVVSVDLIFFFKDLINNELCFWKSLQKCFEILIWYEKLNRKQVLLHG